MKLVATVPARNEAWVLRASIPAMMRWCDEVVALDHASTADDTPDVLGWMALRYPGRLHVLRESDPVWREAAYRARLLAHARDERGATHVAIVDADEILTANAVPLIRDEVARLGAGEVLRVPWLMLWGSTRRYRRGDGSVWSTATAPVAFPTDELAVYETSAGYDIHTRAPVHPRTRERVIWPDRSAGLMHLQHASRRRLAAKQVLYRLVERLRFGTDSATIEARYGVATDETGMSLLDVPAEWRVPHELLDVDAEPWQEAEVRRLLAEHGRDKFEGLNLLGF